MADEAITTPPQGDPQEKSRVEERISQLSDKTRQAEEARVEAEKKAADAEKKAQFAEGYADFLSINPSAREYKQQIQEKFMAGMPVEDAGFAVLGKAGKLGAPAPEPTQPAGGSASTTVTEPTKNPQQMSQEERRAELAKELLWS